MICPLCKFPILVFVFYKVFSNMPLKNSSCLNLSSFIRTRRDDWIQKFNKYILFQFVPILFVISTSSMLILDQRTMQIKYRSNNLYFILLPFFSTQVINKLNFFLTFRVPAGEIFKLSLSPYFDDIAVFHIRAVSFSSLLELRKKSYIFFVYWASLDMYL